MLEYILEGCEPNCQPVFCDWKQREIVEQCKKNNVERINLAVECRNYDRK
jgi:hypothetical protein